MAVNFKELIDADLLAYFKAKLDLIFANKVDKETGKGLSTNDYTAAEKTKLDNIAPGAQVNVLEGIQVNGNTVTPTNKIANISVPTKTSEITNDSGFITTGDIPEGAAASTTSPKMDGEAAVGTELAFARGDHVHPTDTSRQAAIMASGMLKGNGSGSVSAAVAGTDYQAPLTFDSTPTSGSGNPITSGGVYSAIQALGSVLNYKGTVATVSKLPSSGNSTGDVYHVTADSGEYAWNGTAWEPLGSAVDLSGYVQNDEISLATTADIDAMFE